MIRPGGTSFGLSSFYFYLNIIRVTQQLFRIVKLHPISFYIRFKHGYNSVVAGISKSVPMDSGFIKLVWIKSEIPSSLIDIIYLKKKRARLSSDSFVFALPIFTASHPATIVGVHVLNFCVRDGNRWTHMTINTNFFRWL